MAIKTIDNKHFTCLSTDVKPTTATSSDVELEDIITETDTGAQFITHDGLNWVSYGDAGLDTEGLCYHGVVTATPVSEDEYTKFFTIPTLAGLGVGKFVNQSGGYASQYSTYIQRSVAYPGQPPQGEVESVKSYDSATGIFGYSNDAFSHDIGVGDEILIMHGSFMQIFVTSSFLGAVAIEVSNISSPVAATQLAVGYPSDTAITVPDDVTSLVSYVKGLLTAVGKNRVFEIGVVEAANAGNIVIASVSGKATIKSLIVLSNGATTADLTNIVVTGGTGGAVSFISALLGVRDNISAEDQQVSWTGAAVLDDGKTINMLLVGTGATPVDLTVIVEYSSTEVGGVLTLPEPS